MQNLLFSDESAPAPGTALSLHIKPPALAAAQLRFNKLVEKVARLTRQLADTQALADAHRPLYNRTLQPLAAQRTAVLRQLVLGLDERVQQPGLSPAVLRDTQAMVCVLSEGLGLAGDGVMRAVHDRHSPQSLADKEKAAADSIQAMVQRMTGVDAGEVDASESMSDVLHASMARFRQQIRQQMVDEQEAKQAKAAARRASKPRSAAQITAHARQLGAQGALRAIYRQLASALHPDREPDEGERVRKTELMGQANAAYAQRDLMALLTLQLRCQQIGAAAIARLTADKMAALTLLLKEQAAAVEEDLFQAVSQVEGEFALSPYTSLTEASLLRALDNQALALGEDVALIQEDLAAVQTDAGLKGWLKRHKKANKGRQRQPC